MYVPTWQGLNPTAFFQSGSTTAIPFPLGAAHCTYFYRARNAVYHLFRVLSLKPDEPVLVPAFHHGNEVRAIRAAGATIRFYPILRNLEPDLEALSKLCRSGARALFVIHYLGWPQPMKELTALCQKYGMLLIEDCALALFSEVNGRPLGSFADYSVYCLYKTLPVPNGGLLVQNGQVLAELSTLELTPCGFLAAAGPGLQLMLERLRSRWNGLGKTLMVLKRSVGRAGNVLGVERIPVGDIGFDLHSVNMAMSSWCHRVVQSCDVARIRERRRANFLRLLRTLAGHATLLRTELEEGVCPLFFPILVPNKRAAAEALWQRGIGAVEFWNEGDPAATGDVFRDAQFLRDHVLELPIHQDVTAEQVDYMAEQVLSLKLHI